MLKRTLSILLSTLMLIINNVPAFAETYIEHLDVHKNAPCNEVIIDCKQRTVKEGNVLEFTFNEAFYSKCRKAGEIVHFIVPEALYTCEGSMVLPANTKVIAEIIKIEHPKKFNKNARVSLIFRKILFPDNCCIDIKARPFTCDGKLKEGGWVTFGKLFLSTLTGGIIGAGAGVGFAFIPNPEKLATGFAIGIPVGCGVGLITGLLTPGVHYKAKCGEKIYALLLDKFCVYETEK